MRTSIWMAVLAFAASLSLTAQSSRDLPAISYVCPMSEHAQVLEDAPGKCPLCAMVLVPVRIDQAWSCPNHAAVIADKGGLCPIDKRELMPVVVSLFWTCPETPDEHLTEPGRCGNGAARKAVREQRAHGDHNPKHGGQFFMAADKWHHVEATLPRAGTLRVFLYDNFSKPLAVKGIAGRAVTKEAFDSRTSITKELEVTALKPSRDGQSFEARVNLKALPARVTLKMTFDPRLPEERFDFAFEGYSVDPGGTAPVATSTRAATAARTAGPATPKPPAPMPQPVKAPDLSQGIAENSSTDFLRASESLPTATPDLVAVLAAKHAEVKGLLDRGQLGAIYVPALLGKDAALRLDEHVNELPAQTRVAVSDAVRRLVLAAWQLDSYGDLGDQVKVTQAYERFAAAVATIVSAYAPK
ncbi:MAG: heavy metal-binding domain-containing protein [Vicinamibacterales bacterium]